MKKLFVPYKLALLAKEKGFDEPCFAYYQQFNIPTPTFHFGIIQHHQNENYKGNNWNKIDKDFQLTDYINNNFVSVPLYQQLVDWFREKHKIAIYCYPASSIDLYISIVADGNQLNKWTNRDYYQALNKAFEQAFKLI